MDNAGDWDLSWGMNHKKKMLLEIQKKTDAALEGKKQLKTLYCRVGERPRFGRIHISYNSCTEYIYQYIS